MFHSMEKLEGIEGRPGWWILYDNLVYTQPIFDGKYIEITIPAGFVTNLASVPRWLWPIFPPFGLYTRASILHDYLYAIGFSRFMADAFLRQAMAETGSSLLHQIAFFYAVRIFGSRYGR